MQRHTIISINRHTALATAVIIIVFLYKSGLNATPVDVPSDNIWIDLTGIIDVVLTAVAATASTYFFAVFWSGLTHLISTILLLAGDETVKYCAISSDVPATLCAADITTLLLKIIVKSSFNPPLLALIEASFSSPGTTYNCVVDSYIGYIILFSYIYPPTPLRIATNINISTHLENLFISFSFLKYYLNFHYCCG